MLLTACNIYPRLSRGLCMMPNLYTPKKSNGPSAPETKQQPSTGNTQLLISRAVKPLYDWGLERCQNLACSASVFNRRFQHYRQRKKSAVYYFMSVLISAAIVVGILLTKRNYSLSAQELESEDDKINRQKRKTAANETKGKCCDETEDTLCETDNKHDGTENNEDETQEGVEITTESVLETFKEMIQNWQKCQSGLGSLCVTKDFEGTYLSLSGANQGQKVNNIPGFSVAVSVDGEVVLAEGFGLADVENQVPFTQRTLMNVRGLTRVVTVALAAYYMDKGLLDIDAPLQQYIAHFPEKTWDKKPVTLTTRHLLSELSGIGDFIDQNQNANSVLQKSQPTAEDLFPFAGDNLYTFMHYPLVAQPGKFYYNHNGWDLVGAIIEEIEGFPYPAITSAFLPCFGMKDAYFNDSRTVKALKSAFGEKYLRNMDIPYRARLYSKNEDGSLVELPNEDMSDHLPSKGLVTNTLDLVNFGSKMLSYYMAQQEEYVPFSKGEKVDCSSGRPLISRKTMEQVWVARTDSLKKSALGKFHRTRFPMGWLVKKHPFEDKFVVFQHGNQDNALSMLVVLLPFKTCKCSGGQKAEHTSAPSCSCVKHETKGVVISILANAFSKLNVEDIFDWAEVISHAYTNAQ